MAGMPRRWTHAVAAVSCAAALVSVRIGAQADPGPYARIAMLRAHDGDTVDFEAGYIRHLDFHREARDAWTWYGWTVWAGERQRWFVYATFGHAAADLDRPVSPAEDERDNVSNVTPHAEFAGNAVYEFLPALSRGAPAPSPTPRLELTTVDVRPGVAHEFERAIAAAQPMLATETLWYRLVAGGSSPRFVRLRPFSSLAALIESQPQQALPAAAHELVARSTVEILNLRPTMSYRLPAAP
jgi:hypothetical protein